MFLGNSHIYCSTYPNELWNDFGIISYDVCAPSSTLPLSYWLFKNALRYKTPKLLVVDLYHLRDNIKIIKNSRKCYIALDLIKQSKFKKDMVNDFFIIIES